MTHFIYQHLFFFTVWRLVSAIALLVVTIIPIASGLMGPSSSQASSLMQNNDIHEILIKLNSLTNSTIRPHPQHTCRRIKYRTDVAKDYKDCETKMVAQAFCGGQCSSMAFPNTNMVHSSCSMCAVTKKRIRNVKLYCRTGIKRIKVPIAEECGCIACKVENNIPQPPWKRRSKRKQRNYNLRKQKKIMRIRLRELEKRKDLDAHQLEKLKAKLKRRLLRKTSFNKNKKNGRNFKNKNKNKGKQNQKQVPQVPKTFTFRDMAKILFPFSNYNNKNF